MKKLLLAVLMVFCFVPVVHAALITDTFTLNVNNSGLTGGPWGEITLSQDAAIDPTIVYFTVDPFAAAFDGVSDNFGLQVFALNSDAGGTLAINLPDGWSASFNGNISEFGTFSIVNSGTGQTRQDPLSFSISSSSNISLANFELENLAGFLFAGHIAGFTVDGNENLTSAWFATPGTPGTPVPEPGTMMLLGSGLVGLAAWGRKKFQK